MELGGGRKSTPHLVKVIIVNDNTACEWQDGGILRAATTSSRTQAGMHTLPGSHRHNTVHRSQQWPSDQANRAHILPVSNLPTAESGAVELCPRASACSWSLRNSPTQKYGRVHVVRKNSQKLKNWQNWQKTQKLSKLSKTVPKKMKKNVLGITGERKPMSAGGAAGVDADVEDCLPTGE